MQVKVGIDVIEIDRIKDSIETLGEGFINKVFTEEEINYCDDTNKMRFQHYAARFAVKEAFFKAVSCLLDDKYEITWKNIQTVNDKNGKPHIEMLDLSDKIKEELKPISSIDVSISHVKEYATAIVTILLN